MPLKPPAYRKHANGQGFVWIKGKNYYLGKHGTPRSKERYKDTLAEHWEPRQKHVPDWPTIEELMAAYLLHARRYYRDSNECDHIVLAMRPVRKLFPNVRTNEFSPRMLKVVQEGMVEAGLSRQGVNKRTTRLEYLRSRFRRRA